MTEPMDCVELVERVTDHLEGVLPPEEAARVREHLASCDGCGAYVEQVRTAVRLLRTSPGEALPAEAVDDLVDRFRAWARDGTAP